MGHVEWIYNSKWIIRLFAMYLGTWWKNWRNWLVGPVLGEDPNLVIWGLQPSKTSLRCQITLFGFKNL